MRRYGTDGYLVARRARVSSSLKRACLVINVIEHILLDCRDGIGPYPDSKGTKRNASESVPEAKGSSGAAQARGHCLCGVSADQTEQRRRTPEGR